MLHLKVKKHTHTLHEVVEKQPHYMKLVELVFCVWIQVLITLLTWTWIYLLEFLTSICVFRDLNRQESNRTEHFGSTSACARRTTPTLTAMKWISICLRPKRPRLRLWSWWGFVSSQLSVHYMRRWPLELFIVSTRLFDWDDCHVFQTKANLVTPRNGEPLIAAIQDFLTGWCSDVKQPQCSDSVEQFFHM